MSSPLPPPLLRVVYQKALDEYLLNLTLEDIMESTPQATQREITVESLAVVHTKRPDIQYFNELLIQYPRPGRKKPGQVVPDNMVVVCDQRIEAEGSYDIPFQPVGPFWVLEYVSKGNRRKDWVGTFEVYERGLKVPYCLLFEPQIQELSLHRHDGNRYVTMSPNEHGRHAIPELELELALLDGWVRYWFRGELLPLPADLMRELETERMLRIELEQRVSQAEAMAREEKRLRESLEAQIAALHA